MAIDQINSEKAGDNNSKNPRSDRQDFRSNVRFTVLGNDIIDGTTVNISESGIRFDTKRPLQILMHYEDEGKIKVRKAALVWTKPAEEGYTYGLEFSDQ